MLAGKESGVFETHPCTTSYIYTSDERLRHDFEESVCSGANCFFLGIPPVWKCKVTRSIYPTMLDLFGYRHAGQTAGGYGLFMG